MQMALDCGSWPRTIFFPKVKLLSIVEAASSSILMGLNPWFLCSNGRIYHSISILNWLLPMWKKDIGRKAYWLLAKLEKRYMCYFSPFASWPPRTPSPSPPVSYLLLSLGWWLSWQFELGQEEALSYCQRQGRRMWGAHLLPSSPSAPHFWQLLNYLPNCNFQHSDPLL